MKGEGKNTTTLLSIKGFLWEDIKSSPIILSAPASGNIPAGSTHSSPIRSAAMHFCAWFPQKTKGRESFGNPRVCAVGWERLVPKACWLGSAGRMLQIHTPTHWSFWGRLCRWHCFWCQLPSHPQGFSLVCLATVCLVPFMHTVPFSRGSQSLMGEHVLPRVAPSGPFFNSQTVTPWMGFTV